MPFFLFIWNDELEEHLAEHGVTPDEFEDVVCDPDYVTRSRSSGKMLAFGETSSGKYLACVYEQLDESTVLPVTGYEPEED